MFDELVMVLSFRKELKQIKTLIRRHCSDQDGSSGRSFGCSFNKDEEEFVIKGSFEDKFIVVYVLDRVEKTRKTLTCLISKKGRGRIGTGHTLKKGCKEY